jgi:uncharacterized protein (TIGR03905 family)
MGAKHPFLPKIRPTSYWAEQSPQNLYLLTRWALNMKTIEHRMSGGVCSSKVIITLEGNTIQQAHFEGGCEGNLQGICRLIAGMDALEVAKRLRGVDCDGRGTSCPDQLAQAIEDTVK